MGKKEKALVGLLVLCLLAIGYHVWQYHRDQRWLAWKARQIIEAARAFDREAQILALRDYVRTHVRFEGLSVEGRPFLRATARETLVTGKGFCGEATRAFIGLARSIGIQALRVNLYGRVDHVVAEVELTPGRWVLVDLQANPVTNHVLDERWWTLDEIMASEERLWWDYSNINLRRLPFINLFVRRIRLKVGMVLGSSRTLRS